MSLGAPDFGDRSSSVFNPLIYPRRVIIEVLENAFSQTTFTQYPGSPANPYQLVYDQSGAVDESSNIIIADTFSEELINTDPRPIVIVERGNFSFSDTTIDGLGYGGAMPGTPDGMKGFSGRSKQAFQDFTSMSINLSCYARQSLEAEEVAMLCGFFIRFFEQEIRQGAQLHKLESPVISPPQVSMADSTNDLFICSVTLVVYQTLSWVKKLDATFAEVQAGLTNLSGYQYPIAQSGTSYAEAEPSNIDPAELDDWKDG
jgi:hypothetical protein